MKVRDIMTATLAYCEPDATIQEAAEMMVERDCGGIPVLDNERKPIGIITDRDIVCRGVAAGVSPEEPVRNIMSRPVVTTTPDTELSACCSAMEENMVRRMLVVNETGAVCGMIAQADIARAAPQRLAGHLVRDLSNHTKESSRV